MAKQRLSDHEKSVLMRTKPKVPPDAPPNCQCPACVYREMVQVIAEACRTDVSPRGSKKSS